jgi:hypothetical protein
MYGFPGVQIKSMIIYTQLWRHNMVLYELPTEIYGDFKHAYGPL